MACKWINFDFAQGTNYTETMGTTQRILHSFAMLPISNIDSFVNHVYREHNQEADHWANIGAQGRRKIVIDRRDQATVWKAIKMGDNQ